MALSVLQTITDNKSMLYDSTKEKAILFGEEEEMYRWKHEFEEAEQRAANNEWACALREKWIVLLMEGGNSREQAETFMKAQLPFLF